MSEGLTDQVRLSHILDAIEEVEKYLRGLSFGEFLSHSEKKFATIKQIEIIGEACNRMSAEFKSIYPDIPWREINGFRNISIHEYFGVDFQIVWEIAHNDLPVLKERFKELRK